MKKINLILLSTTVLISVSFSALAHDPKEHAKKAPAKANCAAMEKMKADKESKGMKMNMTDPVVMAMMKRCSKNKTHGHESNYSEGEKNSHSDNHESNTHEDNNSDGEHKH